MRNWTDSEQQDARSVARGTVYRMIESIPGDSVASERSEVRGYVVEDLDIGFVIDDGDDWPETDWDKHEDFNELVDKIIAKEVETLLKDISSWRVA